MTIVCHVLTQFIDITYQATFCIPENSLLRVPILYGEIEYIAESPVTILFEKILAGSELIASDYEIKYPTHCGDIAYVIRQLAEQRLQVSCFNNSVNENRV